MIKVETVECSLAHVRDIVPKLRLAELAEIEAARMKPRHLLHMLWRDSPIRRAVLVDGELAALWGCRAMLASSVGEGWLVPTAVVERVPVAFLKEARLGMAEMLERYPTVVSGCIVGYDRALRFLSLVGFRIEDPYPVAPTGALFHHLVMER